MKLSLPAQLAKETWSNSGERTINRLDMVCEHYATVYGMFDQLKVIRTEALNSIPDYMFYNKENT